MMSTNPLAVVIPAVVVLSSGFFPPSTDVVVGKNGVLVEVPTNSPSVGMSVAIDIVLSSSPLLPSSNTVDFVEITGIFGVVEDVVIVVSSVFLSSGLVVEVDCCVVVSAVNVETSEVSIEFVLTVVASSIILPSSFSVVVDDDSVVDVDLDGIWSTVPDDVKSVAGVRFSMDVLCTSGISV